eukprot:1975805-Pyramimonas_sp.AAC.1
MGAGTCVNWAPAGIQHVYSAGIQNKGSRKAKHTGRHGPNISDIGIDTAREFDQQSRQHGRMPKVMNLEELLYVNGVGSAADMCRALGTFTIACTYQHHDEPSTAK